MKFNRKSLARMAVLSSILGFSSFANVLDAQEVQINENADEEDRQCMICLDTMSLKDGTTVILSCGHVLHLQCAKEWLNHNKTCPLCKRDQGKSVGIKINISRGCDNCKGHEKLIPTTSGKTLCYDCLEKNLEKEEENREKKKENLDEKSVEFIKTYGLNKGDAANIRNLLGHRVKGLLDIPEPNTWKNARQDHDRDLNRNVRFGKPEEGVDIGLEESELRKLGGEKAVRLANENKNIDNKLVDLNAQANEMLDKAIANGKKLDFDRFNDLFDNAEVFRAQKIINYNDIGDLLVQNNMQASEILASGKKLSLDMFDDLENVVDLHDQKMINYNNVDDFFAQNNMVLVAE